MKTNKKLIFKVIMIFIISLITSFLFGYFITSCVNYENSYYQVSFTYDGEKNLENIVDKEYLESIKETDENKYGSINIDKLINKKHFSIEKENNIYIIKTKTKYYDNFFFLSKKVVGTRAKTFIKLALTNFVEDPSLLAFSNPNDIVELKNNFSPYLGGGISTIGGVLIAILLISYLKNHREEDIEDNKTLFHTPFHKAFWKNIFVVFKDTKKMVVLAMLFAILLVSKFFSLPSGFGNLGIGLAYIFLAIIGLIYGPGVSLLIGALSDIIGYFITPQQGPFYLGYTLQACLASFTYGLLFYKTRITFSKVLLSRIIVNMLLNVLLGSYLQCKLFTMSGSLNNDAFWATFKAYATLYSLPKNLIYLLPQSIVLFLVLKGVIPILSRFNLIDERISKNVHLI